MKIVADEGVDKQIVERLRANGHYVLYVAEFDPGIDDETVLSRSRQAEGLTPDFKAELVAATFDQHAEELSAGFAVLSKRALRLRKQLQ